MSALVASLPGTLIGSVGAKLPTIEGPEWAGGVGERRTVLRWDVMQCVGCIGINGCISLAVVDTGAHRTVIDADMAK